MSDPYAFRTGELTAYLVDLLGIIDRTGIELDKFDKFVVDRARAAVEQPAREVDR